MSTQRTVSFNLTAKDQASAKLKSATDAVERLRAAQEKKSNLRGILDAKAELRKLTGEYEAAQAAFVKSAKAMDSAFSSESLGTATAKAASAAYREQKAAVEGLAAAVAAATTKLGQLRGSNQGSFTAFSQSANAMREEAAAALAAADALRERSAALLKSGNAQGPQVAAVAPPANRLQAALAPMREAATQSRALAKEYETLRAQTALLGKALAQTESPTEAMINDFSAAKTRLGELRTEMDRAVAQTAKLSTGFQAFSRRNSVAPGPAVDVAATSGSWWSKKVDEFVGASSTAHDRGPLGLRPYELQNLGYQINDLVTQVASGTPVMQAFAQQGGQIAQIFPEAVASIVKMAPAILAATAAIVPLVAAISRLRESARIADEFGIRLAATADGARYSAEQLTGLVRNLESVGIAANDSKTAVMAMMQEGLSVERMQEFLLTAKDFSTVWGDDIPSATGKVMTAFGGTLEAVQELDRSINFLSAEQYKSIKALYDQGRAAEATEKALGIFQDRMSEAAAEARGPWAEAISTLGVAWRNLLDWLGDTTMVHLAIEAMNGLALVTNGVITAISKVKGLAADLPNWAKAAVPFGLSLSGPPAGPQPSTGGPARSLDGSVGVTQAEAKRLQDKADADAKAYADHFNKTLIDSLAATEDKRENARSEAVAAATEQQIKAAEATRQSEEQQNEARLKDMQSFEDKREGILAEHNKARQEREKNQANALKSIDADLAEARRQTALAGMSDEQRAVSEALYQAEQDAAKAGIKLSAEKRAEIEATTRALARQKAATTDVKKAADKKGESAESKRQKELENDLNLILERRRLLMEQIKYQEESGNTTAADRLREQMTGVNDQVRAAIQNMRDFWEKVGGPEAATGLARLDSFELELREIGQTSLVSGQQMNEMLADGGADAIDRFSESLAKGEGFIRSMADAFRQFASDFLKQIAQMIAKQMLLNALQQGGGKGGGVGGFVANLVNGAVMHSGGVVGAGRSQASRIVPASVFHNAPRFHKGGVLGLARGEMPIIGQKGEEMLTRDDPRHVLNGGGAAPVVNLKNVNVFDPTDVVTAAVSSEAGQRTMLNFMSQNSGRVRAALGV